MFRFRWPRLIYFRGVLVARPAGVPPFGFVCNDGKEIVGEHGEGHVPVPGVVLPDLVFVEADLVLGGTEANGRSAVMLSPQILFVPARLHAVYGKSRAQPRICD